MSGSISSILDVLAHLISTPTLWGGTIIQGEVTQLQVAKPGFKPSSLASSDFILFECPEEIRFLRTDERKPRSQDM